MQSTPVLAAKLPSGVNQFGLRPETHYDFMNPTNLINFGKATTFDSLHVRRATGRGKPGSSPSLDSNAVGHLFPKMLGLAKESSNENLAFCSSETASLRVCMAKGLSTCERENAMLQKCLNSVTPLREAIVKAGDEFSDWFTQSVSDNFTKPFTHRRQDHAEMYAEEFKERSRSQFGRTYGAHPKGLRWGIAAHRPAGFNLARRSRLPFNK